MAEPLTLTDILNDLRAVANRNFKHTNKCQALKKQRDRYDDWDYKHTCDCAELRLKEAQQKVTKLLDYVDGKDFNIKLEFSMSWG